MHIVMPMSGIGRRFLNAGYNEPKPLIMADGKSIIEHVVSLFPGEKKFTFICNCDHLNKTAMRELLLKIVPMAQIIGIKPHKKGPVYAVANAFDAIDDQEEVIVNYCDFSTYWDYADFLKYVRTFGADGAIPSYRGFHPHMLGTTNYAFIKDENQWLVAVKEKEPFTNDRTQEFASNGTYYFKKGLYVKKYFKQLMDEDINLNGEYYVSLVYNLLKRDGLKTFIYEVQHMLQWGTPEDLKEYQQWSDYFKNCTTQQQSAAIINNGTNVIPLAGRGNRFLQAGYSIPKPLIHVSGKPMIVQAAEHLPKAKKNVFVALKEHAQKYCLKEVLLQYYPQSKLLFIDEVTQGQACTCAVGVDETMLEQSLLIGACDNGMLWNQKKYQQLTQNPSIDAIIWTFKGHPSSKKNPQMYGWVVVNGQGRALRVAVKEPISNKPENDHAIVGAFYFKKAQYFLDALGQLQKKNIRVNNEFYVDSCMQELIGMGLNVYVFEIDFYVGWGTPNDLKTYEYWQSFFHKCSWHPYRLEKDPIVARSLITDLNDRCYTFKQPCISLPTESCQRAML